MTTCYFCQNANDGFVKTIPAYVADRIGSMQLNTICNEISEAAQEIKNVTITSAEVQEHVTRHICDKRIDACVALQELKVMANQVKNMTQPTDNENGSASVDPKIYGIYLETLKQIMIMHNKAG